MKLIYLHGPPASGKFTIASELESLIGCGVFHNHLTIDAARPFFEFGTEKFWKLVRELRLTCLQTAAREGAKTVIYTTCYIHPQDLKFVEEIERVLISTGGELLPVYLECEVSELEQRVVAPSRKEMRKLTSVETLRQQLKEFDVRAIPRNNCVTISTSGKSPSECAREIVDIIELDG